MRYATLLPFVALALAATADEPDAHEVLYVGHLDRDRIADTVVGIASFDLRMLPTAVHWGAPHPGDGASAARTALRYPAWPALAGSFAVLDINADGVDDLLLFYNASSATPDSARAVALLGQTALRTLEVVALDELPRGVQRAPFVALDLGAAEALADRALREHSGMPSYRLRSVAITTRDSVRPAAIPTSLAEWMALYPNPASTLATFESGRLGAGEYTIDLVDIDGTVHQERRLVLEREAPLKGTIDLSEEPAGLYLVRIRRAGVPVASYPVVVVR